MEARELRIGNWIRRKQSDTFIQVEQYLLCNSELIDYLPIQLTEKWLLKFGFIKEKKNRNYVYLFDGFELIQNPSGEIWFENRCGTTVKYIHQLQNLYFALTNTELICNGEK